MQLGGDYKQIELELLEYVQFFRLLANSSGMSFNQRTNAASAIVNDDPLLQSTTSSLHLQSTGSLIGRSGASSSSSSLLSPSQYLRRTPSQRRSLTPRQAVDTLRLRLTQSNDMQHLLERELVEITKHCENTKANTNAHFDQIINQLVARRDALNQQVIHWNCSPYCSP